MCSLLYALENKWRREKNERRQNSDHLFFSANCSWHRCFVWMLTRFFTMIVVAVAVAVVDGGRRNDGRTKRCSLVVLCSPPQPCGDGAYFSRFFSRIFSQVLPHLYWYALLWRAGGNCWPLICIPMTVLVFDCGRFRERGHYTTATLQSATEFMSQLNTRCEERQDWWGTRVSSSRNGAGLSSFLLIGRR